MQSAQSLEAYTFMNFVAMQMFYTIREHLRKADKLSKYSPMQIIKKLCRIRTVYADGKWNIAEMTKKEVELLAEIGWDIT